MVTDAFCVELDELEVALQFGMDGELEHTKLQLEGGERAFQGGGGNRKQDRVTRQPILREFQTSILFTEATAARGSRVI